MLKITSGYNNDMNYYEVMVATPKYHGLEPLVYGYEETLALGSIVNVPLRNLSVKGVVIQKAPKPSYKTKPIDNLVSEFILPSQSIMLMKWLSHYYPAPLGSIVSQFLPKTLGSKSRTGEAKLLPKNKVKTSPELTHEQQEVIKQIENSSQKTFILHGDTGTGKTRVYLELAKKQLSAGRSVLVLTPEIGLTPQLISDFQDFLTTPVVIIHSNLSDAERRKAWLQIVSARQPLVVIGPRSALFAPFSDLGLVVIDEFHESAYKQEQSPHYNSLRVAGQLANIHSAKVVMGSATPGVADYFVASAKHLPILRMTKLARQENALGPKIEVVPLRDKALFSHSPYISDKLIAAIKENLKVGGQTLIFLNRRGTARVTLCMNCGWQALCPNCALPLTYHGDSHVLRCHTCGHKENAPVSCPVCSSTDIIYKSLGTKSVVDSLGKLFPQAKIRRFDADNKKAERFEQHYQTVAQGEVDIIVGTQLLTKGHDLPNLTLVGVLNADTSLAFPDYTAEERTYQTLSQVIGRVGRGHRQGSVIIQTHNPDSPVMVAATTKDWHNFYKQQIEQRQKFLFPPFCYLLKLTCTRKSQDSAIKTSEELIKQIKGLGLKVRVVGPSPSFWEKSSKGYSWQLVVKASERSDLLEIVKHLPSSWSYDLDPTNLL